MRRTSRLAGIVLAISLAAAVTGAGTDARGSTGTDTCPAVLVVGSRGSGESQGLGKPVAAFVERLGELVPGVSSVANAYPAVSVSWRELAQEIVREPLRASKAYSVSVASGRDALRTIISTEVRLCPETRLILAGFSQGAQATGDVYNDLARSGGGADKKAFDRIAGVVLFADPDYNHVEPSTVVTAFQRQTQSKLRNDGILVHSPVTRPRSFPRATSGRVLSYCVPRDPVCQGFGQLVLHGMSAHNTYGLPDAPHPRDAAEYFAPRLRRAGVAPSPPRPPVGARGDPVVLVLDISGSMSEDDGTGRIKIDGAKTALLNFLAGVEAGTPLALRTYPDQAGDSCNTGTVRFPLAPRDPGDMSAAIRRLVADGDTPTAEALREAARTLRSGGYSQGTLVLVSDGESTCGDPCEAAREIARSGLAIQTITVGFRISPEGEEELRCIAEATSGTYVDIADNAGLAATFAEISQPALTISLDYPPRAVAEVGTDPGGLVRVQAVLRNESQRSARNVVTRLRFDSAAPAVTRPVLALGNLEPGDERTVSWAFRPGLLLAGSTVQFTVLARAANLPSDAEERGSIRIDDETDARNAGPLLRGRRRIAILGDSYSSGEGADVYLPGTDTSRNSCHRSAFTYLVKAFDVPHSNVIACSGAVAANLFFEQHANGVPAQLDQLDGLVRRGGVDAVVLTLGGNDAGFGSVARSCVAGLADCSRRIDPGAPWPGGGVASDRFVDERLDGLAETLANAYAAIHTVVNSDRAVERRDSLAPILVLAYPLPIPLTGRTCPPMADMLTRAEVAFVGSFGTRLNGVVEGAVRAARDQDVPVFFVANSEDAFLPDHTVCDRLPRDGALSDRGPYARALDSFDRAGFDLQGALSDIFGGRPLLGHVLNVLTRGLQELLHPNQRGYQALTRAVIRWSLSPEAVAAAESLRRGSPSKAGPPPDATASNDDLAAHARGTVPDVGRGTTYALTASGFAPGSPVEITIRSAPRVLAQVQADEQGRVVTRVGIPRDLESGRHTVAVVGVSADGSRRVVEIPVQVSGERWPFVVRAVAVGALGTGAAALLGWLLVAVLWLFRRRADTHANTLEPA